MARRKDVEGGPTAERTYVAGTKNVSAPLGKYPGCGLRLKVHEPVRKQWTTIAEDAVASTSLIPWAMQNGLLPETAQKALVSSGKLFECANDVFAQALKSTAIAI
ncbi:hypothetical protein JKP88DRAFT_278652 [Tribonema minus]|uniref:Uncharacterized protein n=1 Tax=Tribonema minus TaxID=303371 RepID=A0A835YVE7_9STRA|nr:hypothetical protein JKP88DRAFT_278652 [Tribonema minus]